MNERVAFQTVNGHRLATYFHDAGSENVVVFCHGFRGSSLGPNRLFIRAARRLEMAAISSLRFDQYGCGNSEGELEDASFDDWVATAAEITRAHLSRQQR